MPKVKIETKERCIDCAYWRVLNVSARGMCMHPKNKQQITKTFENCDYYEFDDFK